MTADLFAPWRDLAACATNPRRFDDSTGRHDRGDRRRKRLASAKTVCSTCPVCADCIADVDLTIDRGVRGGQLIVGTRAGWALRPIPDWWASEEQARAAS